MLVILIIMLIVFMMMMKLCVVGIKQIVFARSGSDFIVSSGDRVIRVYNLEEVLACGISSSSSASSSTGGAEPEPIQKLQDMVNRTAWKKVR